MAALPDSTPDLLDRLPAEQRALLRALGACAGPARGRDLADAAHVSRHSAGARLEALALIGLVSYDQGDGPTLADRVRVYSLTDTGRRLLALRGATPGLGPTIHPTVLADRVRSSIDRVREEIARALDRSSKHLGETFASELTVVYLAGVNDGFAQGVAAEVANRTSRETMHA